MTSPISIFTICALIQIAFAAALNGVKGGLQNFDVNRIQRIDFSITMTHLNDPNKTETFRQWQNVFPDWSITKHPYDPISKKIYWSLTKNVASFSTAKLRRHKNLEKKGYSVSKVIVQSLILKYRSMGLRFENTYDVTPQFFEWMDAKFIDQWNNESHDSSDEITYCDYEAFNKIV